MTLSLVVLARLRLEKSIPTSGEHNTRPSCVRRIGLAEKSDLRNGRYNVQPCGALGVWCRVARCVYVSIFPSLASSTDLNTTSLHSQNMARTLNHTCLICNL